MAAAIKKEEDRQAAAKKPLEITPLPEASATPPPTPAGSSAAPSDEPPEYAELSNRWGPLELNDLGPAASVTATPQGAVFITRDDQVAFAPRSGPTGFTPISLPPEAFSKYGWGPSISKTHVYWTSRAGHLMRASLSDGKAVSLFDHARPATRTSVQTVAGRDIVAFIADIEERSYAYIWASPNSGEAEILDASADGHMATSLALVEGSPHPRLIVLEGRTGMSPVHSRTVRVTPRRVTLDNNEVVWVGPGSHDLTEIHAIGRANNEAYAFLPTGRDFYSFGMAQLHFAPNGGEITDPKWQIFPNGLDPAPIAAAHMCGTDYVLYARPSEQRPRSPQELHLMKLSEAGPNDGEVIARSRAFNDVSLATVPSGAVAVWTADRRAWGLVLQCPKR